MLQFSTALWNAMLDAVETAIGASPTLQLRTGNMPASGDTASSGTVVATMALPSNWMADAANGSKAKLGTWQDINADASGTIGHFEIRSSGGATGLRGSVTLTGGGGDIELDQVSLNASQSVTITAFNLTKPA